MKMTEKQLDRWAKTRKMGRAKFILFAGVLGWGVLTGALWAVAMAAIRGWDQLPLLLTLALVGFPIGGYFFGAYVWKASEKQYLEARGDAPRPADSPDW
jgi:hypothetical protein